jgi:hypothetical protein
MTGVLIVEVMHERGWMSALLGSGFNEDAGDFAHGITE